MLVQKGDYMEVIIDRFEGDYAIVELDKDQFVFLPKILVPGAKEGDVVKIVVDRDATKKRRDHVSKLVDQLFLD